MDNIKEIIICGLITFCFFALVQATVDHQKRHYETILRVK